jgi:hypothetical protein
MQTYRNRERERKKIMLIIHQYVSEREQVVENFNRLANKKKQRN